MLSYSLIGRFAVLTSVLLTLSVPSRAEQASPPIPPSPILPGDIAATGFAGVKLQVEALKPGVDPITKTVVDPDGVTLRIFDMQSLNGPMAGQMLNPPVKRAFKAREIGHVFGLAADTAPANGTATPGFYTAATSAFGLNVVGPDKDGDGQPDRLKTGGPGAKFADGQFGNSPDAGPGSIWKIDQATGAVSLFANMKSGGVLNSGPGIGGLAFDPASRMLYASDLDTGLIHRFGAANPGADLTPFDHGVSGRPANGKSAVKDDGTRLDITSASFDPAKSVTWGVTPLARRIDGLAVQNGRLFYAVAEGPEVWSVGLEADGGFKSDARFELAVKSERPFPVTGIAFDREGHLIAAQRATAQPAFDYAGIVADGPSQVLRFTAETPDDPATPALWNSEPQEYAVAEAKDHRASSGGLAMQYAYRPDGSIDTASCGGSVVVSADTLGADLGGHGLQVTDIGSVRPANVPPNQSAFITLDPRLNDPVGRGFAGGVASFQDCSGVGAGGFPPLAGAEGSGFPPVAGGAPGGFPPVAGGGTGFPPVDGDEGTTFAPVEGGAGGKATTPLTIVKTASVAKCSPKGGCAFSIQVSNPNAVDVPGPVVIDEAIEAPQAALTGEPNAPWSCTKAAPFQCTHPGPVPANGALDMRVVFAPNTPPEAKEVKNCASLSGGAAPSCATIALDPNAPVQTGPIVVSKKGPAKCTAKGPCAFTITVKNSSAAEVKGPIVIEDTIDAPQALAVDVAAPAPWSCAKGVPVNCTHPGPLAAGASVELPLSFVPNTPADKKELKNCAIVKSPPPAAAPAGPAKQLAPDKKTEAPFGRNSLFQFASFSGSLSGTTRHQSLDPRLLHLVGGAGGTIGGALPDQCVNWETERGFRVEQSNGFFVVFTDIVKGANNSVTGKASWTTNDFNKSMSGTFTGILTTTGTTNFNVSWQDGTTAVYQGSLDKNGSFVGSTTSGTGFKANLNGDKKWWKCVANTRCNDYSNKAKEAADEFASFKCGAATPRWSTNFKEHAAWCMGQPANSPFLQSETDARSTELATCLAMDADCTQFGKDAALINDEMKALKCTEAVTSGTTTTGPDAFKKMCRLQPQQTAGTKAKLESDLAACKTRIANGGDAAGTGGPGGAPVPGQPNVPAAEPAPEQCAVVPIDAETTPGDDKVVPPQASVAGTLSIVKSAKPPCRDNRACDFQIVVTNTGDAEFKGPVEFDDNVTGDGAIFGASAIAPPAAAPWACTKGAQGFNCKADLTIPAKGSAPVLPLTMDLGAGIGAVKEVKNCATLKGAPAPTCATIPMQAPVPAPPAAAPDLEITVTGGVLCDLTSQCRFLVNLKNVGQTTFKGDLIIVDSFTGLGGRGSLKGDGWTCNTVGCTANGKTILPGGGAQLIADIDKLGGLVKKNDSIENCAIVGLVGFVPPDNNPKNDKGCATSKLDPFAVKVAKTGDSACAPGSDCKFKISLFNPGPIDHVAPVTITDKLTGLSSAQIVSITPASAADPFPCTPAPTQIPFSCTSPGNYPLLLGPNGEPMPAKQFDMVVRLPNDATAASFTNCASALPAGDALVGGSADATACHTVTLKPPVTTAPVPSTSSQLKISKKATVTSCTDAGGGCLFDITVENPGAGVFAGPIEIIESVKADGQAAASANLRADPPAPWTCVKDNPLRFTCSHPGPLTAGQSVTLPVNFGLRANTEAKGIENCATIKGGAGPACATIALTDKASPTTPPPTECFGGMVLTNGLCACPGQTQWKGSKCVGSGGISTTPGPDVTPPPVPASCFGGMVLTAGSCACPPNSDWIRNKCEFTGGSSTAKPSADDVKPVPPPAKAEPPKKPRPPPADTEPPKKTKPPSRPVCPDKRPVGEPPNCCPVNSQFRNGECQCRTGTTGVPPVCCPRDQRYSNGKCVPREQPQQPQPTPQPAPQPTPQGPVPKTCPDGTKVFGKYTQCPNDKPKPPPKRDCGPGYTTRDTPNKYGNYCDPIPSQQKCPGNYIGTPPNCKPPPVVYPPCPSGWSGTPGNCKPPATKPPPVQKCRPDQVGTPGNCSCPSGTKLGKSGTCEYDVR